MARVADGAADRWQHLQRAAAVGICLLGLLVLVGCSEEPRGAERVPTYPVTGIVEIDGKPVAQIAVACVPVNESDAKTPLTPSAFTDENGRFAIGTYESGDGAPAGTYKLTFRWGQRNYFTGRYEGDRLKGKYATAEKSPVEVTVSAGEPIDLGVIKLTTGDGK